MKSANVPFKNQTFDENFFFSHFENLNSIYHYSVPNVKLYYPEPFIASPSFMHSDLWFMHILLYQYWLWFVFIFIIVFFFLTFLCTLRWCNMRIKPRRETRGVSRSKCGDLITATVPVSWATSIIVNESTDAIDYYDGFGTTELVVGIRAYQWGWEYYYPKDIDLNYNIKPTHSLFVGNSLKYVKTTEVKLHSNNFWKFYQNKSFDLTLLPIFSILSSFDKLKLLNFFNLQDIGANPLFEMNAFKRIKTFSKTFTHELNFVPTTDSFNYSFLNFNYFFKDKFSNSYSYGTVKQHNFLNKFSLLNNQTSFLNTKSLKKLLSFNYKNNSFNDFYISYPALFYKLNFNFLSIFSKILFNNFNYSINFSTKSILDYSSFSKKNYLNNIFFGNKNNSENFLHKSNSPLLSLLKNNSITKSQFFPVSSSDTINTSEKSIRNFLQNNNFYKSYNNNFSPKLSGNNINFFYLNKQKMPFNSNIYTLLINKISFDYPYAPITSNTSSYSTLNYDLIKNSSTNSALLLQGKEEIMPSSILTAYWNFYNFNFSNSFKQNSLFSTNSFFTSFYLPFFTFYYDYDFRNWQSYELFEDNVWETVFPFYNYFEYLDLTSNYSNLQLLKLEKFFNQKNRINLSKEVILDSHLNIPFKYDTLVNSQKKINFNFEYNFFFYNEDLFVNFKLINTKNLNNTINLFSNLLDDFIYDSLKSFSLYFNFFHKLVFFNNFNFSQSTYYSFALNFFRSNYDDFFFFFDKNLNNNFTNFDLINIFDNNLHLNFNLNLLSNSAYDEFKNFRFLNSFNLRNTVKNANVTHGAIQKVFKTRFDENRSHAKLQDLANSATPNLFLSLNKISYETSLGKNKINFLNTFFYKNNFKTIFNNLYNFENISNVYFFDFPFLLAFKSDSSRYFWFDWFAKWGYYEVQPSSSSRYAVFGMPYFTKNFEFNTNQNESLMESENYFIRLSRARRNYLPIWTYSPYLYLKNSIWSSNNFYLIDSNFFYGNKLTLVMFYFNISSWFWTQLNFFSNDVLNSTPTNTNINSFGRNATINWTSTMGYYYSLNTLADILTKREFLYRDLFFKKKKIISLNSLFVNNPQNALFYEIKSSFSFSNSLIYNNEYSRQISYLTFLNFQNIHINFIINFFNEIFTSKTIHNFLQYFKLNESILQTNFNEYELLKNQYRPMRKGISNMIRLHATGAIALPIEIRLQVLASSKDVIHSWAIPSAGIKIDCVPGYSSHRVMIFLVSGIYWGQCMEICGRYHHWMPIVVYFMKRDLFFLWCTHFIHLNSNSSFNSNDNQFLNYTKPVSFDRSSWLLELNKN